jgi:hypothetical protein
MSVNPNDGGPAFPTIAMRRSGEMDADVVVDGLTIRDWFAGQALATTVTRCVGMTDAAKTSYLIADAMLAERAKGGAQ